MKVHVVDQNKVAFDIYCNIITAEDYNVRESYLPK